MELGNKILKLRKQKGLSQEELGEKVNVTRQTISNWELGETQPNTEQLKLLSKELNVSIDELLDNDIKNVLVEKVSNTEQLAGLILKVIKSAIFFIIGAFILIIAVSVILRVIRSKEDTGRELTEAIHCSLYGEEHSYTLTYQEYTGRIIAAGGDTYFYDILDLYKYDDFNQTFNVINDYVKKNGGKCSRFVGKEINDIINMYIKEVSITDSGVTAVIELTKDYDITYGEGFTIEKFDYSDNTYKKVEPLPGKDCVFNDIGYIAELNKPKELKQNWEYCLGKLPKGTYRLVKEVSFNSDVPVDSDNIYYMWTEFTID